MALSDSQIFVTPGTGESVATKTISDKKHQVVILADPNGHLLKTLETYYYWSGLNAGAENKIHFELFNAAAGKVVKVRGLYLQCGSPDPDPVAPDLDNALAYRFDLDKTSAVGTSGSTLTGQKADSANGNISASITARHAPSGGATKSFTLFPMFIDLTNVHRPGAAQLGRVNWVQQGEHVQDLVLREGEGLRLIQITANTVVTWSVHAVVTIE